MKSRLKNVKTIRKKENVDAILISSVPNIIYLTGYSGFSRFEREAFLLITDQKNFLITDGRYSEAVSGIPDFEILEISDRNFLEKILKSLSKEIAKIGIEEYDLTISEGKKFKQYFKLFPLKELANLRVVKDIDEINKIKMACRIGDEAFSFIIKKLKNGISENEVASLIEIFIRKKNAESSFPPIVAFGKNSSFPHHKTGNEKLKINNIVLLDFGVRVDNYCSDMTRTVFFGKADDKFKKIYNTVLESQQKAIDFLNSSFLNLNSNLKSIKTSEIDKVAREYIIKSGYATIPHSLGHGIGIEVHEAPNLSPKSKDILKEGMVFSIEPGIYLPAGRQGLPGFGGVRIEDLVVLENKGARLLTHSPKEIIEI